MRNRNGVNEMEEMDNEIKWYNEHGKYPERIVLSKSGEKYVIGDFSWTRNYPDKEEHIEHRMKNQGVYNGR